MERRIGVIVPFEAKRQCRIDKTALSILLFAKRILDKYSTLGMYGFDDAAMVFLEQIAEGEKQNKDIRKQIEFTVKLMLLHQNRNRLAKDIISEKTAFQKNITNHIMVNLNRLLSVDKRVYSELSQISYNNVKLKEAYDKIVKLENHEKKLVFQFQNHENIRPKSLQRSFYQMFQQLMQKNQIKLSSQLFKESVARKQFKNNLNKLLELQTLRSDVERHEFLHVMKHGTLEERREAMGILKDAVMEVNQELMKKEEKRSWYETERIYHNQNERHLEIVKTRKQEKEIIQIKEILQQQQTIQAEEHKLYKEIQNKLVKQDQAVTKMMKEQDYMKKQGSPATISGAITKHLKSEIHLDRMRYGME